MLDYRDIYKTSQFLVCFFVFTLVNLTFKVFKIYRIVQTIPFIRITSFPVSKDEQNQKIQYKANISFINRIWWIDGVQSQMQNQNIQNE